MINKERLLNTFLDYVRIDSESGNEAAFAARLAADLEAIGCQVYIDDTTAQTGANTGNVYATLPGNTDGEPILFSAHMDTVVPGVGIEPVVENGIVRSAGNTILGGDDKSGVVAVVEGLRTIVDKDLPHPTIQGVFSVSEEVGLKGAKAIETDKLAGRKIVVLDSGGDAGSITNAAPGQYKITAAVQGRRAHAGIAPETGISAIQVMAEAIANMKLLRIDEETTANIGVIRSDFPANIVPDRCEILAEARSRDNDKLEAQTRHMVDCLKAACEKYGAALECETSKMYAAYSWTDEDPFVQEIIAACEKVGLTPVLAASGGGSDANIYNGMGYKAVNLGTGMAKVHTTDEEISIKNLEDTAELVLAIMLG